MDEYSESERRNDSRLSREEIEAIASRAAQIVQDNFTLHVGQIAIRLALYVCGAGVIAILTWLGIQGHLTKLLSG